MLNQLDPSLYLYFITSDYCQGALFLRWQMTSLAHAINFDISLMLKNTKLVGLILVCLLGLSACGQKGPLTMPAEPASNQPAEATSPVKSNQQEPR